MTIRKTLFCATLAACFALALTWLLTTTSTTLPPEPKAEEHWYIVQLQGQNCGFMHSEVIPQGDEVCTRSTMKLKIRRDTFNVIIAVEQQQQETRDGRPLSFRQTSLMGEQPTIIEGTIKNGKIHLVRDNMGVKFEDDFDFDPDIKFAWGMQLEQMKHGLAPGTTFKVKSYDPTIKLDAPFEVELSVTGKENVELPDGIKRELTRISSTILFGKTGLESLTWVDDDGLPLMMDFQMGMFTLRVLHTTKEQAMEECDAPELFLTTFVKVDKTPPPNARQITYRLRIPKDMRSKLPDLPQTGMQKVKRVNNHEALVTVRRIDWDALRKIKENKFDKKIGDEFLQASSVVDTNDNRIKRIARRAIKGKTTPAEIADALRERVTQFVEEKGLDVGFATASEVARSKKGDCTEHSVLLAAVARAAGLPARGVSGIIMVPQGPYSSDKGCQFGYHMWTQVYIGGKWVDIDAAMRQTDCAPTHIALTIMPLNDEGMADSIVSIVPLLGQLEMEIVSAE